MASTEQLTDNYSSVQSIDQQIARYRAKVYETYYPFITPAQQQSPGDKPAILVVEDNADEWFLIRWALLQRFPQAHIEWIANPEKTVPYLQARQQAEIQLPMCILVDLYLPKAQTGLKLIQAIKSLPGCQATPTVVLSRSADPNDIVEVFNYSANSYIVKPATYTQWVEELAPLDSYCKY